MNKNKIKIILFSFVVLGFLFWQKIPFWQGREAEAATKKGLVGYWNMDNADISGRSVLDSGGQNHKLTTFPSAATTTPGKIKQAITFDGANGYASSTFVFTPRTNSLTVSAWVRPRTYSASGSSTIMAADDGNPVWGCRIDNTTKKLSMFVRDNSAVIIDAISTSTIQASRWTHIACVWDLANERATSYIDGRLENQITKTSIDSTTIAQYVNLVGLSSNNGAPYTSQADYFNGDMDEMRIYTRVLSTAEINSIYESSKSIATISSPSKTGLVAYWNMDNADINGTTVFDKSGSNNNLTRKGAASIVPGKIKQAGNFGASTDNYTVISTTVGNFTNGTISAWINPSVITGGSHCNLHNGSSACRVIAFNDDFGYMFGVNTDGAIFLDLGNGSNGWLVKDNTAASKVVTNKWQLVTATVSGTSVTYYINGNKIVTNTVAANNGLKRGSNNRLGIGGSLLDTLFTWVGKIDDVRIYNRALTGAEVSSLYNSSRISIVNSPSKTGLVAYWNMDNADVNGTTLFDKSGYNNSATSTGTSGAVGKLKQARYFNGTSDFISTARGISPDTNTDIFNKNTVVTYSAWFKTSTSGVVQEIIARENYVNSKQRGMYVNTDNTLHMVCNDNTRQVDAGTTATVTDGKWHLATGIRAGSTVSIYLDGVMASSSVNTSLGSCNGQTFQTQIGRRDVSPYNYFNGSIDEVRIYNRVLSEAEVSALYSSARTLQVR